MTLVKFNILGVASAALGLLITALTYAVGSNSLWLLFLVPAAPVCSALAWWPHLRNTSSHKEATLYRGFQEIPIGLYLAEFTMAFVAMVMTLLGALIAGLWAEGAGPCATPVIVILAGAIAAPAWDLLALYVYVVRVRWDAVRAVTPPG